MIIKTTTTVKTTKISLLNIYIFTYLVVNEMKEPER